MQSFSFVFSYPLHHPGKGMAWNDMKERRMLFRKEKERERWHTAIALSFEIRLKVVIMIHRH
jgi:hypothetical protein